jgi:hypothetical protein
VKNKQVTYVVVDDVGEIDIRGLSSSVNAACDRFFRSRGIKYTDDDVGAFRAIHSRREENAEDS